MFVMAIQQWDSEPAEGNTKFPVYGDPHQTAMGPLGCPLCLTLLSPKHKGFRTPPFATPLPDLGGEQVDHEELMAQLWKKGGSHSQGQASLTEERQFLGLCAL